MSLVEMSAGLARRREAERAMVEEGQAMWRQQREQRRLQHLREQKELQEMLARYSPWGRPGGGAPNPDSLRKRKMHVHELYPDGDKGPTMVVTGTASKRSKKKPTKEPAVKSIKKSPSKSACVPAKETAQKSKKKSKGETAKENANNPSKEATEKSMKESKKVSKKESKENGPVAGAGGSTEEPSQGRTAGCSYSGHRPPQRSGGGGGGGAGGSAGLRSDALLSFQPNDAGRRCVDNVLRYRQQPQQQEAYRKELDAMVQERRRRRQEEVNRCSERERWRAALRTPWGRPGPGGFLWRDPAAIGLGFLRSMGWSDENTLQALASRHFRNHENTEGESNGVELVPLLARRRAPSAPRHPLSSTDVTRAGEDPPALRGDWKAASARSYTQDLTQQVMSKKQYQHRAQLEEVENCRRHFATWQSFWGRPGHGAPKADTGAGVSPRGPALRRLNLDHLLRRVPVA